MQFPRRRPQHRSLRLRAARLEGRSVQGRHSQEDQSDLGPAVSLHRQLRSPVMAIPDAVRKASLLITWALLLPVAGAVAQEYENPPEVLRDAASRGAADIVSELESGSPASEAADVLDQVWDRLVFYTVADALPGDDPHEVRGLQA